MKESTKASIGKTVITLALLWVLLIGLSMLMWPQVRPLAAPVITPLQPKQSIRIVGNSPEGFLLIEPLTPPRLGIEVGIGPPVPKGTLMINCQPDELQTGDGLRPVLLCQDRILIVRGIQWQPAK